MNNKIESVVIVTNEHGSIASLRFTNSKDDRDISSPSKSSIYTLIERHIREVQRG